MTPTATTESAGEAPKVVSNPLVINHKIQVKIIYFKVPIVS